METPVRLVLSVLIALILEFLFFKGTILALKEPKREIKRVIRISLVRKTEEIHRVRIEREKGKDKVTETKMEKNLKTNLKSKKPVRKVQKRSSVEKREKGEGLKPLQGNLPEGYVERVKEAIEEQIFYPLEAIQNGIEGEVVVQFTLNRSGKAVECKPLSGNPILSQATCIAIRNARFPKIPENIKNDKIQFQLQINYNLKKAVNY